MPSSIKATVNIAPIVDKLSKVYTEALTKKAIPAVMARAQDLIRQEIILRLPDGSLSREKQTAKVRAKFYMKLRESVIVKTISDEFGTLKIIGVNSLAGQVNFDFGPKARGEGRRHVLWWPKQRQLYYRKTGLHAIGGEPQRLSKKSPRKQLQDIPAEVEQATGDRIGDIFEAEVAKALQD